MVAVPVFQTVAALVVALFVLRVLQALLAKSNNPIAQGVEGGLSFLIR